MERLKQQSRHFHEPLHVQVAARLNPQTLPHGIGDFHPCSCWSFVSSGNKTGLRQSLCKGLFLLLWQFSIPVLIANLIAWPVAWFYLHGWLEGFAYRIALSPLYFLGAGLAALLIAWATVFSHARRVAGANPIHALRYE